MKRKKRLVAAAPKRRVPPDLRLRKGKVAVHGNDPLAIGIEELERTFFRRPRGRSLSP
jgi:hypothetical protein